MRQKRLLTTVIALLLTVAMLPLQTFAAAPRSKKTVTVTLQSADAPTVSETKPTVAENMMTVKSSATGKTVTDTVYNILCMVVEAEVGSGFHEEAIKAQTVATHSYLLFHAKQGRVITCPLKTPKARVKKCVAEVVDQVLTYKGKVAEAVYSASSGGGTQASADYWGKNVAYLQPADSPYDLENEIHSRTLDREYVRSWFPESTFDEDPNTWFEVVATNSTGFALQIRAGDKVLTGLDFTSYDHIWLKSNKIVSIVYNESSDTFTFTVAGRGHGIGLSQIGANGYATYEDKDYEWILLHYFTGVSLQHASEVI